MVLARHTGRGRSFCPVFIGVGLSAFHLTLFAGASPMFVIWPLLAVCFVSGAAWIAPPIRGPTQKGCGL